MSPFTELSPEGLASAVWNSLSTEFNTSGTMGAKLNTASSGGVDMNALAQAVWEYGMRSLTESAGLSTEEHEKLMSLENSSGGGGFSINYQAINNHTTNKTRELKEYIDEKVKSIPEVDLSPVIDKIDEIEIPEVEIEEFPQEVKKKIDKISKYIDQEQAEKEKEEKEKQEEEKLKEEAEKQEINAIVQAIKEVDKEHDKEILKAIKEIDKEHEENIINALNSL